MSDQYVVEKRDANGDLIPGPGNRRTASKDSLFDEYFVANQWANDAAWSDVEQWFKDNGWRIRPRTW